MATASKEPSKTSVNVTPAAAPADATRGKIRVALSPTLADRVIYADGVQGAALRAGVVHLDLYQVVGGGNETQGEQRVISHRLALPLGALNEVAGILANVNQAVKNAQGAGAAKPAAAEKK